MGCSGKAQKMRKLPSPAGGWRRQGPRLGPRLPVHPAAAPREGARPAATAEVTILQPFCFINGTRVWTQPDSPKRKARPLHSGCPPPSASRLGFTCQHPASGALSPRVTPQGARPIPLPLVHVYSWSPGRQAQLCAGAIAVPHTTVPVQGARFASRGDAGGTGTLPGRRQHSARPQEGLPRELAQQASSTALYRGPGLHCAPPNTRKRPVPVPVKNRGSWQMSLRGRA